LAIPFFTGAESVFWPLIFAVVSCVATTLLVYYRFCRAGFGGALACLGAFAVFLIGPLHSLPLLGMENCLQILLDLLFGFWLLDTMGRECVSKDNRAAVLLTSLMCLCRYESIFLVVVPVAICLFRRDWRLALAMIIGPVVAIGGFGVYSHFVGMPMIPNSIVLKGNLPHSGPLSFIRSAFTNGFIYMYMAKTLWDLLLLTIVSGLALLLQGPDRRPSALLIWLWTLVVATILHIGLARIGQLHRYEAYLCVSLAVVLFMAIRELIANGAVRTPAIESKTNWVLASGIAIAGLFIIGPFLWTYRLDVGLVSTFFLLSFLIEFGPKIHHRWVRNGMIVLTQLALGLALCDRALLGFFETPKATRDIYLQQFQMARFVERYYPKGRLAANDIGAVSYFSQIHLLDLVGLASDDVRKLNVTQSFTTGNIKPILDRFQPDLAIIYPMWFHGLTALPESFIPVATWTIPPATSAAYANVVFYAPSEAAAVRLRRELTEFRASLPSRVKVDIY